MRLLVLVCIALSIAAAACGGDDDGTEPTNTPVAGASAATSPVAGTATSAAAAETPTAEANADFAEEFGRLGNLALGATFHVTYDMTLVGVPPGTGDGTAAWYSEPPRTRFDFSAPGSRSTLVVSPDGNFLCQNGVCEDDTAGEYDDALAEGFGGLLNGTRATARSEEQIAGYAAVCFEVEATRPINFEVGKVCFSDTGIPLVLEGYAEDRAIGGGAALAATSVATSVPPGAFDRP